jgi:hypothetical protein
MLISLISEETPAQALGLVTIAFLTLVLINLVVTAAESIWR